MCWLPPCIIVTTFLPLVTASWPAPAVGMSVHHNHGDMRGGKAAADLLEASPFHKSRTSQGEGRRGSSGDRAATLWAPSFMGAV